MPTLQFTTITPLHIASGQNLGFGLDYIIMNGNSFCKIDFKKIADKFAEMQLFDFMKPISLDQMIKLIEEHKKELSDEMFSYRVLITPLFNDQLNNPRSEGQKFVSEFINSNGKFYIPASTIKGALLTVAGLSLLGIDNHNPVIGSRFVIQDSESIPQEDFNVFTTNERPPKTSLICLKRKKSFQLKINKIGQLDVKSLRVKLSEYSINQIRLALENIAPFKSKRTEPMGADVFEESLHHILNIECQKDEYLINLGYGGGSWFKIRSGNIPMFKKMGKDRGRSDLKEAAHTSFTISKKFTDDEETGKPEHLGWCKLKIEED